MEQHRGRHPARGRVARRRHEHPGQPERRHQAPAQARQQDAAILSRVMTERSSYWKAFQKFRSFRPSSASHSAGCSAMYRFACADQYRETSERFSGWPAAFSAQVIESRSSPSCVGRKPGRNLRITGGGGIVAHPEIQPAVRREQHRVVRDEVVMDPRRRAPGEKPSTTTAAAAAGGRGAGGLLRRVRAGVDP